MQVADPVERAALADQLMWTASQQRSALRGVRAAAIRQALEDGSTTAELARRMRVTEADVAWMADHPVSTLRVVPLKPERAMRIA
ncbi:hypothetical protein CcI49_12445 [Frankia sp. CcI49]|uniref:Homeodomain-like domain-containing protein n=2 Tax=Parafrankia TaxID=2994362 RepID=A0A0S4QJW3_9ACTN|nr:MULTISPECIES: hypothetical protein [Frankiaceae]MBE3205571.1 hypothetical protein [Parafrankia sp. CH37]EFC79876.1 hypothetical protein FrEUN1fDRAFT_6998 [Parafrankia sp. EUN1f]KPM57107.1 hypothetical protein ACG83_04865 [Frankia sp. R43]ONH60194.1 hypothetical protein CcI49_12445 [Frankia sp. CcI49]CUU55529.1 hypothetical protein Ga0074812_105181 [Parafrankia irregularis]